MIFGSPAMVLDRDFDFTNADFYLYGRQSDKKSFGNASTRMQTEDLLVDVVNYFKIDPHTHPHLRQFHEIRSAVDGRVRYQYGEDGSARVTGLRPELVEILNEARNRVKYTDSPRPQIICVSIMNRLGRSEQTVAQIHEAAVATEGRLFIWSVKDGAKLLNPLNPMDMIQITFAVLFAGKRESEDKSKFVRAAKIGIMEQNGRRVIGKIPTGYETFLAKDNGASPPEPVTPDWTGKTVTLLRVNEKEAEDVRLIFELFLQNMPIARIVRHMNSRAGIKKWTRAMVRGILENPIYIGRRVYNRKSQVGVATNQMRRTSQEEWTYSPYEPELRIISDEVFYAVQSMLENSHKRSVGRPMNTEYLFHRIGKLRCGICGNKMVLSRRRAEGIFRYYYICMHNRVEISGIRCQSALASDVDAVVRQALRNQFSDLKSYALRLKEEIHEASSSARRRELEKQLRIAQDRYEKNARDFMNPEFRARLPGQLAEKFLAMMNEQLEEIEALKSRLSRWGETEDVRYKQKQLATISGVLAFDRTSPSAQRAVIAEMFEAVYLWPFTLEPPDPLPSTSARLHEDAVLWLQWKGETLESAPLPIGFASAWPPIDYDRLRETVRTLMDQAMLTKRTVAGVSKEPVLIPMSKESITDLHHPITILRAYANVRKLYVNMPALQADVRARLKERLETARLSRVWKETRIYVRTLEKILAEESLDRQTWLRAATALGLDLDAYRNFPPEGVYHPEGLEQVVYWLTGVAYPEYLQWVSTLDERYKSVGKDLLTDSFAQPRVYANRQPFLYLQRTA